MKSKRFRIAFTGHRGKYFKDPVAEKSRFANSLIDFLDKNFGYKNLTFVLGGAQGVDSWAFDFALAHSIPVHLYVPFKFEIHTKGWPQKDKDFLKMCYDRAKKVVVVNEGGYYPFGYQKRNIALVDNSDVLLTYYHVEKSGSGNCVKYAIKQGKPIFYLYKGN